MERPDDLIDEENAASYLFTDRVPESKALCDSLLAHQRRVWADQVIAGFEPNVLTYYGMGGVGKSRLSERLEAWLTGSLGGDSEWGAPPLLPAPALTVRWDLNDIRGNLDLTGLLISLRAGLMRSPRTWAAFDLAFAAYLGAVRPGEAITIQGGQNQTDHLFGVLTSVAGDLGAADIATTLSSMAIRRIVKLVASRLSEHRELRQFPKLGELLARCQAQPAGTDSPSIATDLLWLLTEQFEAIPPRERPTLVIFIDAFERVQDPDASRAEATLNRLVAHLPFALFVITGRNQVDWHDPTRAGLKLAGARRWPSLVPGRTQEPRQHVLGRLSPEDAASLFRKRRLLGGWPMDGSLVPALVEKTAGWPLHMDAVCRVADNLTEDGVTELTAGDLVLNLPDLLRRLLEDLTHEQARAFHAACLLPYFDVGLATAVAGGQGQVPEAAVWGCIRRAIVEQNPSQNYPYRVHDEIRFLVRRAGCDIKAGWTDNDWSAAAQRGVAEARRRHEAAVAADDDRATMEALALAITIGVAHSVHADWIGDGVRFGPTIRGLAPLVPAVPSGRATTEAVALVQLINALNAPKAQSTPIKLREIFEGPTAIAEQGGRWRVYRLRALYRPQEALQQLEDSLQRFPERARLYHHQYSVTLRMMRRFQDEIAYRAEHGLAESTRPSLRLHGYDFDDLPERLANARGESSRRHGFEQITTAVSESARHRPVPRELVMSLRERAVNLGDPVREADTWIIECYHQLHDEAGFEEALGRLTQLGRMQSDLPRASIARVTGLRALITGSSEDVDRAWAECASAGTVRMGAWIFTEFVMERVGRPLPPVPTQWLESIDDVRARWYTVIDGLIERSRLGRIMVPGSELTASGRGVDAS